MCRFRPTNTEVVESIVILKWLCLMSLRTPGCVHAELGNAGQQLCAHLYTYMYNELQKKQRIIIMTLTISRMMLVRRDNACPSCDWSLYSRSMSTRQSGAVSAGRCSLLSLLDAASSELSEWRDVSLLSSDSWLCVLLWDCGDWFFFSPLLTITCTPRMSFDRVCDACPDNFPATRHCCRVTDTKQYCLVTESQCVNNLPKVVISEQNGRELFNFLPLELQAQHLNHYTIKPHTLFYTVTIRSKIKSFLSCETLQTSVKTAKFVLLWVWPRNHLRVAPCCKFSCILQCTVLFIVARVNQNFKVHGSEW